MIFKPRRVSSPLADSWLSLTAPTDAQKKCLLCELRQGGGAYGKSAGGAAFSSFLFLRTCSVMRYPLILWIRYESVV